MCYYKKVILFLFLICGLVATLEAQQAGQIRVERGVTVPLNVNSLNRYRNGYELENWTRLVVQYHVDSIGAFQPWRLEVFADANSILGDYGSSLEVKFIGLKAFSETPGVTVFNVSEVSMLPTTIAQGVGPGTFVIFLGYQIGKGDDKLLGLPSDYFMFDLFFDIKRF